MSNLHDGEDRPFDPDSDKAINQRLDALALGLMRFADEARRMSHVVREAHSLATALDTTNRFRGVWTKTDTMGGAFPPAGPLWLCDGAPSFRVWFVNYTGNPGQLEGALHARYWMPANVPLPAFTGEGGTVAEPPPPAKPSMSEDERERLAGAIALGETISDDANPA